MTESPCATASACAAPAAAVLGAGVLLLRILSMPPGGRLGSLPAPTQPAVVDVPLIITGQGPAGEPGAHHFYNPQMLIARRGDTVRLRVTNLSFASHALEITNYGVRTAVLPGGPRGQETVSFVADRAGVFPYRCYVPYDPATGTCSPDHPKMTGYLVVLEAPSDRR